MRTVARRARRRQGRRSPHAGAPLAIRGAGRVGQDRVLTRRIAYRVRPGCRRPRHVLAITFTRRAAGELLRRLDQLGLRQQPTVGVPRRGVVGAAPAVGRPGARRRPVAVPAGAAAGRVAAPALGRGQRGRPAARDQRRRGRWAGPPSWPPRSRGPAPGASRPSEYEAAAAASGRRPAGGTAAVAGAYRAYETAKRAAAGRLRRPSGRRGRRSARPGLRRVSGGASGTCSWTEMQDVNPLQLALLEAWRGDRPDLCAVGDPSRAIYEVERCRRQLAATSPSTTPGRRSCGCSASLPVEPRDPGGGRRCWPMPGGHRSSRPPDPSRRRCEVAAFDDELAEGGRHRRALRAERRGSAGRVRGTGAHAQLPVIERALRRRHPHPAPRGSPAQPADVAARWPTPTRPEPAPCGAFLDDLADDLADGTAPPSSGRWPLSHQLWTADPAASVASFRAWPGDGGGAGDEDVRGGDAVEAADVPRRQGPGVAGGRGGRAEGFGPHASATTAARPGRGCAYSTWRSPGPSTGCT